MVPYTSGLQKSDGARLWQLLRHPDETRRLTAFLALQTEGTNGLRPREWSPELFAQLMAVEPSETEYPRCQLLAYYRGLDQGDELAALPHLENVVAKSGKVGKVFRPVAFLEAASACAGIRNQPDKARAWRERAVPLLRNQPEAFETVDASIAMSEGRYEDALPLWQAARDRLFRRRLDSGLARFALDKLAEAQTVCEGHIAARVS
jgi:hypothetical protein